MTKVERTQRLVELADGLQLVSPLSGLTYCWPERKVYCYRSLRAYDSRTNEVAAMSSAEAVKFYAAAIICLIAKSQYRVINAYTHRNEWPPISHFLSTLDIRIPVYPPKILEVKDYFDIPLIKSTYDKVRKNDKIN